jgi:hypothetical protein
VGIFPVSQFNDELDGADAIERGNGTAGDDGEIGREGRDGDEPEVGAAAQQLVGAESGLGVMKAVALGELRRKRWVLEVPHQRCGVKEVDSSYADGMG